MSVRHPKELPTAKERRVLLRKLLSFLSCAARRWWWLFSTNRIINLWFIKAHLISMLIKWIIYYNVQIPPHFTKNIQILILQKEVIQNPNLLISALIRTMSCQTKRSALNKSSIGKFTTLPRREWQWPSVKSVIQCIREKYKSWEHKRKKIHHHPQGFQNRLMLKYQNHQNQQCLKLEISAQSLHLPSKN